jgi:DNA-binding protein H-NS
MLLRLLEDVTTTVNRMAAQQQGMISEVNRIAERQRALATVVDRMVEKQQQDVQQNQTQQRRLEASVTAATTVIQEIRQMSQSIADSIVASTKMIVDALAGMETDIHALAGQLTPGTQVTQEQADALTAAAAGVSQAKNELDALVNPAPPAQPPPAA